jgi:hypothetical protein
MLVFPMFSRGFTRYRDTTPSRGTGDYPLCTVNGGVYSAAVSDHRGSNSQVIDFESVKVYPIFTIKIKNPGKSNT